MLSAFTLSGSTITQQTAPADSLERKLQEIVVTASRPGTRLEGSTLVSTIAGTDLANVGTALDALAQLPLLTVTDGNIEVIGKGTPEIYIDGKPMSDPDRLHQLMSDNLQKVEVVLAPGALYSADTPAVLRITTRRNAAAGLSVTDRASVQKKRQWSAVNMLDLNYHAGQWDFFATATAARHNNLIKGTTVNTLIHEGEPVEIGSSQHNSSPSTTYTLKAGANFTGEKLSAGAYYRFNPERGRFSNLGSEWISGENALTRHILRRIDARSHMASAYFDYSPTPGGFRLHFDGDFRHSSGHTGVATTYPDGDSPDVNSDSREKSSLIAGKLYALIPLWSGKLTAGLQDSYTRANLDFYMNDPQVATYIPSTLTTNTQTASAAFLSWSRTFGNFSLDAGLRYEYTRYTLDTGNESTSIRRTDHMLSPDISLSYTTGNDAGISLSYKTATLRPPYSQLTGSLNYVGRHEIEGGNTALQNERMHNLQMSASWSGFILQANGTRSIDTYGFIKRPYEAPTLQLLLQPVNMNVTSLGVFLTWSRPVKAWTPAFTAGMRQQWLRHGGTSYDGNQFFYYLDNTFSLPHGIIITANAYGQSAGPMHTNRFGATPITLDLSIGKHFWGKSLQVKLEAIDVFNTLNNDWTMQSFGITTLKRQTYDRRGISLSLTYRLRPRPNAYRGSAASQSELDRL